MGMFTKHYVIGNSDGLIWTGEGWSDSPFEAMRIHDQRSAEKILKLFFKPDDDVHIIEDE